MQPAVPAGVRLLDISMHHDSRGCFSEVFREEWFGPDSLSQRPVQWNLVQSRPRVLRGVHVHFKHEDYLILAAGRAVFGLHDMRRGSPTFGVSALVEASGERLRALVIPPGVGHGFYFFTEAMHLYAVSHYFDSADDLGCRFDDPQMGLAWPDREPIISERDRDLPALAELLPLVPPYRG